MCVRSSVSPCHSRESLEQLIAKPGVLFRLPIPMCLHRRVQYRAVSPEYNEIASSVRHASGFFFSGIAFGSQPHRFCTLLLFSGASVWTLSVYTIWQHPEQRPLLSNFTQPHGGGALCCLYLAFQSHCIIAGRRRPYTLLSSWSRLIRSCCCGLRWDGAKK